MVFLRNALATNLDTSLTQLGQTSVAGSLLNLSVTNGQLGVTARDQLPPGADYFVAVYGPDGTLLGSAGGDGTSHPVFPSTFALQDATTNDLRPFTLPSSDGESTYRAVVGVFQIRDNSTLFTQLVAVPTTANDRVIGTFLGIYSILAILTVVASAFLVRWIVTLTFRSLGQVESTAMAIAAGDFSLRMTDIEPMTTEVGRLKASINTMLGRVDTALGDRDSTVRQMRRFIGDASHELRTPLVTVRGYAELYRMGAIQTPDETAQAMDRIEKEAIRMTGLVENLLALARLDEKRAVEIVPLDLRPIARDAALDVRAAAPQRTVTVIDTTEGEVPDVLVAEPVLPPQPEAAPRRRGGAPARVIGRAGALLRRRPRPTEVAVPPRDAAALDLSTGAVPLHPSPPIVMGDENQVRQVVANLLGNARRYSPEDSPVELRVGVDADRHAGWLEVIDHGDGIPEQIRAHIFERFWRADTSRTRETGGSGLGLSIVASIVETLEGTVDVRDTPGGGATFRVSLPLALGADTAAHLLIDTQPLPRLRDPQP
ncbi:HAMP domain-containing sensor histidine kinase [Microbacterium sp. X-17]|uniref:sensor histidine kinase n=1 Tax=Microbacterium sp. X-17 TaxID=3144404 RepID=UPI0031F4B0D3